MRTTGLVTCSQTTSRPSLSIVIPLPLLDGLATSLTPESGSQRRRTSPGMSLKSRKPSGFQMGPSVKVKPLPSCSTSAPSSTSSRKASALTWTPMATPLLIIDCLRPGANLTVPVRPWKGDSAPVSALDPRQQAGERLEAREVVAGHEAVDRRQRGAHAGGQRLVVRAALDRVDPHHRVGRAVQARHLAPDELMVLALPAVGGDEDHRAARQRPAPPDVVVALQRRADARPAGPVDHALGRARQRHLRVAGAQLGGQARQARAEREDLDAAPP